jgi:hypothetical protein
MSVYGYVRVSTDGQTLDAQVAHLKGCRSRKGLPREGERRKGRSTRMHSLYDGEIVSRRRAHRGRSRHLGSHCPTFRDELLACVLKVFHEHFRH